MRRRKVARQPRGGAATGPDARSRAEAGRSIQRSTDAREQASDPLTEAEVLLGATMWLVAARDWFAEELDLAPAGAGRISLRVEDMRRARDGLSRAVALLDTLTVDPTQIRAAADGEAPPQPDNRGLLQ